MRPTIQIYKNYTKQDFKVWEILFKRQMTVLKDYASADFLTALEIIDFRYNKIPDFTEVNKILKELTGWSLYTVPNISAQKEFFEFLSRKQFTTTCWLRNMDQLDYLEEPDMFHDVFAHTPLLTNKAYCDFFKGIGDLAIKNINNLRYIELLGRIYWFTIEFGLIKEKSQIKIYGAGILSSIGETTFALSEKSEKINFNVETILNANYRTDIIQEKYFVIESFEQLINSLPEIEKQLAMLCSEELQK